MTLLDLSHRGSGIVGRFREGLSRLAEVRARRSLYRRTVRELSVLDDRILADVGLNRETIDSVARKVAATTRG